MWMLSLNGAPEGCASATLPENHQLAAKSAARKKASHPPEIL
jgi:predicted nucleic acid binding AN1-type Zn finger protein